MTMTNQYIIIFLINSNGRRNSKSYRKEQYDMFLAAICKVSNSLTALLLIYQSNQGSHLLILASGVGKLSDSIEWYVLITSSTLLLRQIGT